MKRKNKIAILALACFCFTLAGVACAPEKEQTKSNLAVELEYESLNMTIGDTKLLMPEYTYVKGVSLEYSTSNESVVSVSKEGVLTAKAPGSATVTVKYGSVSDTCEVLVGFNSLAPILKVPAVNGDKVQMSKASYLDLSTLVSFNGLDFTNAEVSYKLKDDTFGTIENGIFMPAKTGATEIYINAKWNGVESASMSKTINISVISNIEMTINGGLNKDITLYSLDNEIVPFSVLCKEDGVEKEAEVTLIDGEKYVEFDADDYTLQSKGLAGNANLKISFTATDGVTYEKILPVNVKHTVLDYAKTVKNFSAIDGDVVGSKTLGSILGEPITAVEYGDGEELEVIDNKVYGLPTSGTERTDVTMTVYGLSYAYKMNVEAYTKVIDEAEDFALFYTGSENQADIPNYQPFDGYYILADNIDAYSYSHARVGEGYISSNAEQFYYMNYKAGLTGTFDGNGYTVEGITFDGYGLFGHVNSGTVKNVAFTNVSFTGNSSTCVIAAYMISANVQNVYIQTNGYGGGRNGVGLAWYDSTNSTMENILVEAPTFNGASNSKNSQGYGSLSALCGGAHWNFLPTYYRNVFVISPEPLTVLGRSKYQVDGENREEGAVVPDGFKAHYLSGVYRYDTKSAMQNDKLQYNGLSSEYWTSVNGVLTWKGKQSVDLDESLLDAKISMFSADDGDIDLAKAFNVSSSQNVTLEKAYQGSRELTVQGNKILGVKPQMIRQDGYIVGVKTVAVTLVGKVNGVEKSAYVGLQAYTKVIDEATDLAIFHDDAPEYTKGTNPQDGYYILSKNIDASNYQHALYSSGYNPMGMNVSQVSVNNYATGLRGTFDGNGYTISGITLSSYGLFGHLNGGVVKNVAFKNVKFGSWNSYCCVIASYVADALIENVYIQANAFAARPNYVGYVCVDMCNSTMKNVLIVAPEYTGTATNGYGSISAWDGTKDITYSNPFVANTYQDVYVVSKTPLTVRKERKYVVDAQNRANTIVSDCTTVTVNGVYRYDDYTAMNAAGNKYTSFNSLWKNVSGQLVWQGRQ